MKIEALRLEKPWTQEELAEACGLNVRTIQRAESGQAISGKSLKRIAKALNTDISELDIGYVTLDLSLIDRKLATQFRNVKVSQGEANTHIEIYFRSVALSLQLILAAVIIAFAGSVIWIIRPVMPVPTYAVVLTIFLTAPFSIYAILKDWLGKITIDISPKSLRQQLHIGAIKVIDRSFDADLLSDFEVCKHSWPRHTRYYLQFQYGFKTTRMEMAYFEAGTRFVMGTIEQALEST